MNKRRVTGGLIVSGMRCVVQRVGGVLVMIAILGCLIPGSAGMAAAGADTPSTAAVQWIQPSMNIEQAITSIARGTSDVVVVESWVDIADLRKRLPELEPVDGPSLLFDPHLPLAYIPRVPFSPPNEPVNTTRGLELVIARYGLERVESNVPGVIHLVRRELLRNAEWPLNQSLEDAPDHELTWKTATEFLSAKYRLSVHRDKLDAYADQISSETVVCAAGALRGKTVRYLVDSMAKAAWQPRMWFSITPQTPDHRPETDEEYSKLKAPSWHFGWLH